MLNGVKMIVLGRLVIALVIAVTKRRDQRVLKDCFVDNYRMIYDHLKVACVNRCKRDYLYGRMSLSCWVPAWMHPV